MNAIDLLTKQHRNVDDLFGRVEGSKYRGDKQAFFEELADALAVHATLEEELFYPAALGARTEGILREAVEEHLAMKRLISDLLETNVDSPQFDARLKVLKKQVQQHVQEEEGSLFLSISGLIGPERLNELGGDMKMLAERLQQRAPRKRIPDETDAPAHLGMREYGARRRPAFRTDEPEGLYCEPSGVLARWIFPCSLF